MVRIPFGAGSIDSMSGLGSLRRARAARGRALALAIVVALLVLGAAAPATAANTPCDDQGVAGGDIGNDFGPGVLFVGVDTPSSGGGLANSTAVCVTSGAPLPFNNESLIVTTADPNPGTAGVTVAVDRRSCTVLLVCQ